MANYTHVSLQTLTTGMTHFRVSLNCFSKVYEQPGLRMPVIRCVIKSVTDVFYGRCPNKNYYGSINRTAKLVPLSCGYS